MSSAYLPLRVASQPPLVKFQNGVEVTSREAIEPVSLDGYSELFSGIDRRELAHWHRALWMPTENTDGIVSAQESAEINATLNDSHVALQVVAPVGNYLPLLIWEGSDKRIKGTTRFERFHGTVWSRMSAFGEISAAETQNIANGVLTIFDSKDPRVINPLRMFEQGLISSNPYIRILLWTSAMDSLLMAVKTDNFIQRLSGLLGAQSLVFPKSDGVYIVRDTTIEDVAADLFELRSEVAHGRPIGEKFWKRKEELTSPLDRMAYGDDPRYVTLLEESALAILRKLLHLVATTHLETFLDAKKWKAALKMVSN